MHNGFVLVNEEKMSKSLQNFVTIKDVLEKYDANTIRFLILTNHYRMPIEFGDDGLKAAKAGVKRLKNAVDDVKNMVGEERIQEAQEILKIVINELAKTGQLPFHKLDTMQILEQKVPVEIAEELIKQLKAFTSAMDEDINTSKSLAILFDIAGQAQKAKDMGKADCAVFYVALLLTISDVLGFDLVKTEKIAESLTNQLMDIILSVRNTARTQKNWEISDKIRDELDKIGITVKDLKDGKTGWNFKD
jgi:cysteinyl-tRNA synthetase